MAGDVKAEQQEDAGPQVRINAGSVKSKSVSPRRVYSGKLTADKQKATRFPAKNITWAVVTPLDANVGKIFIGDNKVSDTAGLEMEPGVTGPIKMELGRLDVLYLYTLNDGDGVTWIAA